MDESEPQTKAIMKKESKKYINCAHGVSSVQIEAWKNIQRVLEPLDVKIPYAEWLADNMPSNQIRFRRDFTRILLLIKVCALLHQYQRKRITEKGREYIIASFVDYYIVKNLIEEHLKRSMGSSTSKTIYFIKVMQKLSKKKNNSGEDIKDHLVSIKELEDETGKSRRTINRWLEPAIQKGYIEKPIKDKNLYKPNGAADKVKNSFLPKLKDLYEAFPEETQFVHPIAGKKLKITENGIGIA